MDRVNRWLFEHLKGLFTFGRERSDDLTDERNFTALLVACDGRIMVGDLVALYGWSVPKANDELTRLLVDYGGDIEVTDGGRLAFSFPDFQAVSTRARPPAPAWERERAPLDVFREAGGPGGDALALTAFVLGVTGPLSATWLTVEGGPGRWPRHC